MQQTAIVHSERVSRKGEIKYFQIPLPGKTKKIIAVEASAFVFTAVNYEAASSQNPGGALNEPLTTTASADLTYGGCPNPGKATIEFVLETDTGISGVNMQIFRIGTAVNPGFIYMCGVYSVVISVTATEGDTPQSIATKLADEVNNTSLAQWNQYGTNSQNYKPTASADGDLITLTVDYQHSFFASGRGECPADTTPPAEGPPPLLAYDPLFLIGCNEKAGMLSLQSPDITDIFFQGEVFRQDRNIAFGDFTKEPFEIGEWVNGKKRISQDVSIISGSPIIEAYYKDSWGAFYDRDIDYQLNIFIWIEKHEYDK